MNFLAKMFWCSLNAERIIVMLFDLSGDKSGDDEGQSYNKKNVSYVSLGHQEICSEDSDSMYEPLLEPRGQAVTAAMYPKQNSV